MQTGTDGRLPSLPIPSRNGSYRFDGWFTSASVGTQIDTNTVFTSDDTVYAHWTYTGDSSSSSDSDSDSTTTWTIQPGKDVNTPTTVTKTNSEKTNASGQLTMTITKKMVQEGIAEAQKKWIGREKYGIALSLENKTKNVNSLTVVMESDAITHLVSQGLESVTVQCDIFRYTLDKQALFELHRQSIGHVTVTVTPYQVSGAAQAAIDSRPVYNITYKDGRGTEISSFGKGTISISIAYKTSSIETGRLFVVHVKSDSDIEWLQNSSYDNGWLIFSRNGLSVYGVGYTAPSAKFTDISSHWGKESIDYVFGRGLLSGTSETTFAPDTAMTRGMLVTALGRLANVDVKAYTTNSFTDVKSDSAFRPYIEWAYKKGIVQGIGSNQFAPDRAVTREEIAVIFANFAKATGYTLPMTRTATTYADASSIGSVYKTAVTAMQQAGIMMGGSGNKFNPKASATRAEVSAMLHRYIKLTIDPATAQGWALNDAGQYLYYKDGKVLTGTQTIDGVKYYFNSDGTLARSTNIDGYEVGEDGVRKIK